MAKDKMGVDDTEMGSYGARDGDKGYMDDEGTGTAGDVTMDPDMEAGLDTETS
jgi:hypothetical protein